MSVIAELVGFAVVGSILFNPIPTPEIWNYDYKDKSQTFEITPKTVKENYYEFTYGGFKYLKPFHHTPDNYNVQNINLMYSNFDRVDLVMDRKYVGVFYTKRF